MSLNVRKVKKRNYKTKKVKLLYTYKKRDQKEDSEVQTRLRMPLQFSSIENAHGFEIFWDYLEILNRK